jgi:hypothetical protein
MLKPFGSVTVQNGHIHQVVQKVEGNVALHTAMATAFPQPASGTASNPGPMVVPAGKLESVLGVTKVKVIRRHSLRSAARAAMRLMLIVRGRGWPESTAGRPEELRGLRIPRA